MLSRKEMADAYHRSGYNCAQAVACAFADDFGYDKDTVYRLLEGLGLGAGNMQCTCGAVTGAAVVCGMENSSTDVKPGSTKAATYRLSGQINKKFMEKNGALKCEDLKGVKTGKVLRSCPGCIADAVEITEEVLGLNS